MKITPRETDRQIRHTDRQIDSLSARYRQREGEREREREREIGKQMIKITKSLG